MELAEVHSLVGRVAAVDSACADSVVLRAAVGELRRLRSWVDGREVLLARLIAGVSSFPEKSLSEAGQTSLRAAEEVLHRASTVEQIPAVEVSLDAGRLSGGHVDVLTRVLRQLEPSTRGKLIEAAPHLVVLGEQLPVDEFGRTVRAEARRLERDSDGLDRLERQRRALRLNSWTDRDSGMRRWAIAWDPETAVRLETRLDAQVEALFHDTQPPGCPSDLFEKQSYLRAHALLAMIEGGGVRFGRPEIIVVVDHSTGAGEPVVDWGLDVELPQQVLDDLYTAATVHTVVVRNGTVIDAPGDLELGRTTRLANRAQRRALHGLYPTCAIPGCRVRYPRTKLHHVIWWRFGGRSDLGNFLPVCEKHHQNIHNDGWLVTLGPNRELSITLPDGQIMTTGPPTRSAS